MSREANDRELRTVDETLVGRVVDDDDVEQAEYRCRVSFVPSPGQVRASRSRADVECRDCESATVSDVYKGDEVVRCASCESILARNLDR
ncbi:hypothetical protein [Halosimplex amylolyticum]|uniref:hypothetical protein n=1 Tax=Halosimplex amylolyticum TaxID=3396616 RepID=UPI003F559979